MIENINEALIDCVKACGGSKIVGPVLWPEKGMDAAQRLLLDCLNPERPAHLTPEQMVLVLRKARERGYHAGAEFLMMALSYGPPIPIDPRDEAAELQRQFIERTKEMQRLVERIERVMEPRELPPLRNVA